MPYEVLAGPGPRGSRRYAALGLLQALLALEALAFAVFPPTTLSARDLDYLMALGLCSVAILTVTLLPHMPRPTLHFSIALTWMSVGLLAWSRTTPQGQVTVGLSLVLLTVYVAYFLRGRAMVAHIAAYTTLYVVILVMHPITRSPLFAAVIVGSIAFAAVTVPRVRENDIRYRLMLFNSADVIIRTRLGKVTWVSPSVTNVLGWDPNEFRSLAPPFWHPHDDEVIDSLRAEVHADRQAAGTYRLRCKDGTYRWVEARLNPIRDSDGVRGSVGSLRDVHERVLAERAMAAAEERYRETASRLEKQGQSQARLIQNLSHELRTPLTVIRGPLQHQLGRTDIHLSDELREDLETAVRASRRMERIVDDMLATSREHSLGEARSVSEPTDAGMLTGEVTRLFAATAAAAGLSLDVTIDDGIPRQVEMDREAWTRILLNLLSNAFKYTAQGGVRVELGWDSDMLRLRVHDSGVGVAEDERDLVFERFYQARARPVRGEPSSGVGLAMVADLVRAAGGTCSIDSELGRGTTFTVLLPAPVCSAAESRTGGPGRSQPDPGEGADVAARILVVEDEVDAREFLSRILTRAGYSVVAVGDAVAARRAMSGIDVVLTDVGLNGESGIDLLHWVRAQPARVGIVPVILVSASVDHEPVAHGLAAGADDYVAKPFDADDLCARVAVHVKLHRHRLHALAASAIPDTLAAVLTVDEAVGAAIGAMMADRQLTPDEALAELREASRSSGRPLADVALDSISHT